MASGSDIVIDALFACGAYGQGDNLSNADAQLCLRRLNRMLDSWSNLRTLCYQVGYQTFNTVAGQQQYSSALLSGGRPVSVDSMFARLSNVDYPISLIDNQTWGDIAYKPVQSVPSMCWLDTGFPDTTFNFYPIPNAVYTMYVACVDKLSTPITLTTVIALPPGYEKAMVDNLAVDIAPSFGRQVSPQMAQDALASRKLVETTNYSPLLMDSPFTWQPDFSLGFLYKGF